MPADPADPTPAAAPSSFWPYVLFPVCLIIGGAVLISFLIAACHHAIATPAKADPNSDTWKHIAEQWEGLALDYEAMAKQRPASTPVPTSGTLRFQVNPQPFVIPYDQSAYDTIPAPFPTYRLRPKPTPAPAVNPPVFRFEIPNLRPDADPLLVSR